MLSYIFHVTLCWSLFALLYALLLRHETFFRANRIYLLSALALGLALPFANQIFPMLNLAGAGISITLPTLTVKLQQAETQAAGWTGLRYLWWIYTAGVLLTASRLAWGLAKLGRMAFQNPREPLPNGCVLIRTSSARLPFSFFHWIFVPVGFDTDTTFQNMLAHERAHVRGWHSVDVITLELLCIMVWFHPLVHWYRRALRTVHEYLADSDAASQTDRREYGLLLLRQAQPALALSFANHFFQSPLKQRLLMLTKNSSAAGRSWRYSLVFPLVFVLWTCTQTEEKENLLHADSTLELFEVEKIPEFPGGNQAFSNYLASNIQYPEAARRENKEGFAVLQITIDERGQISQVKPVPMAGEENSKANQRKDMVDEAIRVVRSMPQWTPAYKNGEAVACKLTLPIKFKLE